MYLKNGIIRIAGCFHGLINESSFCHHFMPLAVCNYSLYTFSKNLQQNDKHFNKSKYSSLKSLPQIFYRTFKAIKLTFIYIYQIKLVKKI